MSKKQIYLNIIAKIQGIADLGSQSKVNYEKVINKIKDIGNDLLGIKKIKEGKGIKSGRPPNRRIKNKPSKKCQICAGNHLTQKCPFMEDVRK